MAHVFGFQFRQTMIHDKKLYRDHRMMRVHPCWGSCDAWSIHLYHRGSQVGLRWRMHKLPSEVVARRQNKRGSTRTQRASAQRIRRTKLASNIGRPPASRASEEAPPGPTSPAVPIRLPTSHACPHTPAFSAPRHRFSNTLTLLVARNPGPRISERAGESPVSFLDSNRGFMRKMQPDASRVIRIQRACSVTSATHGGGRSLPCPYAVPHTNT